MTGIVEHLIFLHGRNARPDDNRWLTAGLDPLLELFDRSRIDPSITIHRPYYGDLLEWWDQRKEDDAEYPPVSHRPFGSDLGTVQDAYASRRRQLLEVRGRRPPPGAKGRLHDHLPNNVFARQVIARRMADVQGYIEKHWVRRAVMQRLYTELPDEGRMLIVAHSLGSVVALDYLHFLPRTAHVDLMITLGSPLPSRPLREQLMGTGFNWPWANLGGWINLYDPADVVTGGEPLEPIFGREVVDVQVDNGKRHEHRSRSYLSHGSVVRMTGALVSRDLAAPLPNDADAALVDAVLVRSFGRRIEAETPVGSQRRRRMSKAREHTERALLADVQQWRSGVDSLAYSLTDVGEWFGSDTARLERVLALLFSDPFAPFDTEYRSHEFQEGARAVGLELGARPRHLRELLRVIGKVRAAHESHDWKRLARTAGLVDLAFATSFAVPAIGARAGRAGTAATTHGLAVAGSGAGGGLMAGLGVAGAASDDGVALAAQQASRLSSREFEAELARLQAAALLEKRLSLGTSGREGRQAMIGLSKELNTLAVTHREVEGEDSKIAFKLDAKRKLTDRSLSWLNERFDSHEEWKLSRKSPR